MDNFDMDDSTLPSFLFFKEERPDYEEEVEKKYEPPIRRRTRSLTKKPQDKIDIKAKLERSRQSARECRARKKLRYQYLEEIISETEKAIFTLRKEQDTLINLAKEMDQGILPENLIKYRNACVERKLAAPFELQQHHHNQIQLQRQQQQQPQQHSYSSTSSGFCGASSLSPVSTNGFSMSHLYNGGMNPFMTMSNHQGPMLSHSISPS